MLASSFITNVYKRFFIFFREERVYMPNLFFNVYYIYDCDSPSGDTVISGAVFLRHPVGEKDATADDDEVLIVSFPRYCRYRAALRRLATDDDYDRSPPSVVDALSPRLLAAVGLGADLPPPSAVSTVRVLFCRATVAHPVLQKHAFRLDELGTG